MSWIKSKHKQFMQSKFLVFLLGIIIATSFCICFYEGKDLKSEYDQSMKIWEEHLVHKANAQRSGEEVSANSQAAKNGGQETALSIEELIKREFRENYKVAFAIAKSESSLNPLSYHKNSNGSVDCGLFQINSVHNPTKEQCENPEENIKLAKKIYDKSGFNPWVAYKSGKHLKFM